MLEKYEPLWVNVHFNHPREVTREAALACPTTFVPVDAAIVGFVEQAISRGERIGRGATGVS